MDEDIIDEYTKKDSDAIVTQESDGSITIDSELFQDENGLTSDDEMNTLIDDTMRTRYDVTIQVTRIPFMVNCILSCLIITGFIPYQFLVYDEPKNVSIGILIASIILCFILYIIMAIFRRNKYIPFVFALWTITYYTVIISIAAIMRDFTPLQFGLITFLQSVSILAYCAWSPSFIDYSISFYLMLAMGIIGWIIGLYAYISKYDWIAAILLLAATIGSSFYLSIQIKHMSRYCLSYADCVESVIRFYTDPIIIAYEKIKERLT